MVSSLTPHVKAASVKFNLLNDCRDCVEQAGGRIGRVEEQKRVEVGRHSSENFTRIRPL